MSTHLGKHGVFNGDSVQQLLGYLERHYDHLARIERAVQETVSIQEYTRKKSMVALDGTGAGVLNWQVPLGYDWILERVTITSTGNGTCAISVDTTQNSDIVEIIGSTQLYSDAFDNNIYVPGGSQLYVVFAAAGNNGQATVNLQIKVLKRRAPTHRREHYNPGES